MYSFQAKGIETYRSDYDGAGVSHQEHRGSRILSRNPCTSDQVKSILLGSIEESILQVTSDRLDTILKEPLVRPLIGSGEIGFQSPRASIRRRDSISVVSPH